MNSSQITHWLRYQDSDLAFAAFMPGQVQVKVVAVTGLTTCIDRYMGREEARSEWARLIENGWHRCTEEEVRQAQITPHRLRLLARD